MPRKSNSLDNRAQIAEERMGWVEQAAALRSQTPPLPWEQVAGLVGQSTTTTFRLVSKYLAHGYTGIVPKTDNCGRESVLQKLARKIGPEALDGLLREAAAVALDTGSAVLGFRLIAKRADVPEEFAQLADYAAHGGKRCSKHALSPSIRDQVRIDKPQALKHRGDRALNLKGMWTPRRLDIMAGDIWTSDDTTPIWGWWVPWPHALGNPAFEKASCEFKFGVKLLQGQYLPLMDVASNDIFSAGLIARETSGYRAADIWALFGRAFALYGLPRLGFQFERGSWEANLLRGVEVEVNADDISFARRVGGLRELPSNITAWHREKLGEDFHFPDKLQIWTSYLPKSKPVEAAFDRMQSLEGTLWGCLGRDQMRKPFEKAKKIFQACQRGAADPRLHFLSGEEMAKRLRGILDFLNDEPMEGQVFKGVPRLLWEQATTEHPLYLLPTEKQYLFRRSWHVTKITRGLAKAKFEDLTGTRRTEYFTNPGVFAQPGMEGKEVVVYFDAGDPTQAAQIVDAATSEFICEAEFHDRPGMFLDAEKNGHDLRRLYNQAVTTYYIDVAKRAPSRQLPPEIQARREAAKQMEGAGEPQVTRNTPATVAPKPARKNIFHSASPEEFERQAAKLERQTERARRMEEVAK